MTKKKIRRAKPADLDEILEVYRFARQFMVENGNPTQWKDGYPSREMLEEDIRLQRAVTFHSTGQRTPVIVKASYREHEGIVTKAVLLINYIEFVSE